MGYFWIGYGSVALLFMAVYWGQLYLNRPGMASGTDSAGVGDTWESSWIAVLLNIAGAAGCIGINGFSLSWKRVR